MTSKIKSFHVGNRTIGENASCLLIAEVGLAHDGSLGTAHAFIDAVADTGADAIKFQTHIAAAESTIHERFRVNVFPQDDARYDYWERTSFSENQWAELKRHAEEKNLIFLSTPFSVEAVQMLRRIGVNIWKIGSGETNNVLLLDEIASHKEPILLSTGMSFLHELDAMVKRLEDQGVPVLPMQCTNRYPCPPEKMGLNMIPEYQERYHMPIGYSDHSGEIGPGLAALTMGAKVIEVHVTWHKECFGPDVKASLTLEQLSLLADNIRILEKALLNPVDKDSMAEEMGDMRKLFTKGIFAKTDIKQGEEIKISHIDAKNLVQEFQLVNMKMFLGN